MVKPIEEYKYFSLVAWVVVIAFGLFTLSLAYKLQQVANDLQSVTEELSIKAGVR